MILFLTSSPTIAHSPKLNPAHGFVDRLRQAMPDPICGLFICSHPETHDFTDRYASDTRKALEKIGIRFTDFSVLDGRNTKDAAALVNKAGLIYLAGGHVPTQNAFFRSIRLRELMSDYHGVVFAVSAGSMNSADIVYAQPEETGESIDPNYRRFLTGLALTDKMILPHYNETKDTILDGKRLYEDITYPDSIGRCFYIFPDGTYLYGCNGHEEIYGPFYVLQDGKIQARYAL